MSHAEYFSRPFPLVAKLAAMLRNNAAMQFVFARFSGLLRSHKSSDEPLVSPFLGEIPGPGEMPSDANADLPLAAPELSGESAMALQSDPSERENLIRRRWAETGIKMWNPNIQAAGHATLNIQGRADLLPAKPGATRREYDRLEFKLMAGQIACEGVVVDPPKRAK
jgi:hypothetical protein